VRLLVGGVPGSPDGGDGSGEATSGKSGGADGSSSGGSGDGSSDGAASEGAGSTGDSAGTGSADATGSDGTGSGAGTSDDGGGTGTTPPKATASVLLTLEDVHFEFDKTFPLKSAIPICRDLAREVRARPPAHVLVVGHADKTGAPGYNKDLSAARAQNIASMLHDGPDDLERWVGQYQPQKAGKQWGAREDQHMLTALPMCGAKYFDGPVTDAHTKASLDALHRFQRDQGLPEGKPDDETRRRLVLDYLNATGVDVPASIPLTSFGASFSHALGGSDADDRRVDVFLFAGAIEPDPSTCDGAPVTRPPQQHCDAYDAWKKEVTGEVPRSDDDGCGSHPAGALLLTVASTLLCPHGGKIVAASDSRAQAVGASVLRPGDTFTIEGCPLPTPCAALTWVGGTVHALVGGQPALTSGSLGLCRDSAGHTQGIAQIVNTQPRVQGT
jgi:outer membrane protein OmpA-like peptidoglycan-associated protein